MIHNDDIAQKLQALDLLLWVSLRMSADMAQDAVSRGVTPARLRVLWEIGNQPGLSQRVLAERLGVTPRNVTAHVDGLEASGLVVRAVQPGDRRAFSLNLTATGTAEVTQLQEGRIALAQQLFGTLPDAQLHAFVDTMNLLSARLDTLGAPSG